MKYKSIVIGALLAAVLLTVSVTLNYRNTSKIREYNLAVDKAEDAINALNSLLSQIKDAENGQRGYLLSGETIYLQPYLNSIDVITENLKEVEASVADNPSLTERVPELKELVTRKMAELKETVELRRDRGYQPAVKVFSSDEGLEMMTRINSIITEMIVEERQLLSERLTDSNEAYKIAIASGLLSGLSALASIAALFLLVRRHVEERERNNRVISEQSDLLRTTLASIGDGVITTDNGGFVTGLNEVAEEITGWKADDANGLSIKRVFPVYYAESDQEAAHPVLSSIHTEDVVQSNRDTQLEKADGHRVFIDCSASPILDDNDVTLGCVLTFKDTTTQRAREAALEKSEARLRAAFENAAVGIAHAMPDERLGRVNQRLCEIVGYSEEELLDLRFSDITHPDDLELTQEKLRNMLTGEFRSQRFQKRYIRKDGSIVWVNKTISLVRDSENRPDYYIAVIEDITARIKAEEDVKESEAHLRRVLDNTSTFIGVLSPEGDLLEINQAALDSAGMEYEDCIGKRIYDFPSWSYDPVVQAGIKGAVGRAAEGETIRYDETILDGKGERVTIDFILNPAFNDEGEVTYLIATGIDIRERKRLEEELRVMTAELSLANKRKDEFLATLAHELRNPMAPIRTGLEILRLSQDDPLTMAETREMMERQTEQLIRLVDDLLDVSRITRGKLELRKQEVSLDSILTRATESSEPLIKSFGHTLTTQLPEEDIILYADKHRLSQVVSNLLNNAAKYTQDGGKIELSAAVEENNEIAISVRDNGIGIEPEMKEFIFEMFGQLKGQDDLSTSGLGIGLTLARSLTEQHGGSIHVDSEGKGKGSVFTIKIPIRNTRKAVEPEPKDAFNDEKVNPRKVLIVDDSPSILKTMSMVIKLQGHEVATASDGQEAIEVIQQVHPDIVFMDIGMPRTNGYEAAKLIREEDWGKNLVLVALTGWGGEDVSKKIKSSGFDHHVVKPPEPDDLRRLIATAPIRS